MKFKSIVSKSWFIFLAINIFAFIFWWYGAGVIADEYNGGNEVAEIFTQLMYYFWFPFVFFDNWDSYPNYIFTIIFWGNPIIITLTTSTLLNLIYLRIKKFHFDITLKDF